MDETDGFGHNPSSASAGAALRTLKEACMGGLLRFLIALILGAAVGVGSALWLIREGPSWGGAEVGGWTGSIAAGSASADPYTRAIVAARGLLALSANEAVYFSRSADAEGAPLREACVYRVSGSAPPARWWSLTAYAPDEFLPQNDDQALSYDATRAGDGPFRVQVGGERPADGAWISTRSAGTPITLMLRLYHPNPSLLASPSDWQAPRIETVNCAEDGT